MNSLPRDVDARYFTWPRALLWRYDVLHVHWPELMARRPGKIAGRLAPLLLALLLLRLTVTGRPVVRTLHNAKPHESGGRFERSLTRWMEARTVIYIALTRYTDLPAAGEVQVIPHGDYTQWFAEHPRSRPEGRRLVFFGLLRPYKGIDGLLDAFSDVPLGADQLRIVGRPATSQMRTLVESACARDERITARLGYVDDAVAVEEITRGALVVLPYQDMHNSGALLLALSLDRPVLVPANDITRDLQREVGSEWVHLYEGALDADAITRALTASTSAPPVDGPDLSARRWPVLGEQHAVAYRRASALSRRRPG